MAYSRNGRLREVAGTRCEFLEVAMDARAAKGSLGALALMPTSDGSSAAEVFLRLPQERLTDKQVLDWQGISADDSVFMLAHAMDYPAPRHRHDFYEFSYVYNGTVINIVDGQRLFMLPDTLCVMNLNSTHALEIADRNAIMVNLCIRRRLFEDGVFRSYLESDGVMARFLRGEEGKSHLFFTDSGNHALANSIARLAQDYADAGCHPSFSFMGHVLVFLDELSRTPTYSFYGMDARAMRMVSYIQEHCATASVKTIAREFGYSENYCTQYIKRHTGRTASELIADARVARAEELLRTSDMSVRAIAEEVGYRSVGHFNALFRSYHDMTPGEYRMLYLSVL